MRILEQKGIRYLSHSYPHGNEAVDGMQVAAMTGLEPRAVWKTLVCSGASRRIYVFVIPVCCELNLKKAAKAAGEKSIAMVPVKELLALTGYVRGGCSPIGMKKQYQTFFHDSLEKLKTVAVSAGKIGWQLELAPQSLMQLTRGVTADLVSEE